MNQDMIQYAGFTPMNYYTARNQPVSASLKLILGQYNNICGPTGYAHGAAMMVKKEAIAKAGLDGREFLFIL